MDTGQEDLTAPDDKPVEDLTDADAASLVDRVWKSIMLQARTVPACEDELDEVAVMRDLLMKSDAAKDVRALATAMAIVAIRAHRLLGYKAVSRSQAAAHRALQAMTADEQQAAWDTVVETISGPDADPDALTACLVVWCDAYVEHATEGRPMIASPTGMAFMDPATGALHGPEDSGLPVAAQWAGRVIAARCTMDEQAFMACIDELPDGNIGGYVMGVLGSVASTIRGFPRGWATIGTRRVGS